MAYSLSATECPLVLDMEALLARKAQLNPVEADNSRKLGAK